MVEDFCCVLVKSVPVGVLCKVPRCPVHSLQTLKDLSASIEGVDEMQKLGVSAYGGSNVAYSVGTRKTFMMCLSYSQLHELVPAAAVSHLYMLSSAAFSLCSSNGVVSAGLCTANVQPSHSDATACI